MIIHSNEILQQTTVGFQQSNWNNHSPPAQVNHVLGRTKNIPSGKHLHNYGESSCFSWENSRHFDWAMALIANCKGHYKRGCKLCRTRHINTNHMRDTDPAENPEIFSDFWAWDASRWTTMYPPEIKHGNGRYTCFIGDFPIETSSSNGFPIATFDETRGYITWIIDSIGTHPLQWPEVNHRAKWTIFHSTLRFITRG